MKAHGPVGVEGGGDGGARASRRQRREAARGTDRSTEERGDAPNQSELESAARRAGQSRRGRGGYSWAAAVRRKPGVVREAFLVFQHVKITTCQ